MKAWFRFGTCAGQALVISGSLDLLMAVVNCLLSIIRTAYGGVNEEQDNEEEEPIRHLDYLELTQATVEGAKIVLALVLWIGMILIGRLLILKVWMYLTIAIELAQMILIGVVWLSSENVSLSPLHFMYLSVIRVLIRAYLVTVAFNYSRVYAKFRAKGELAASANISPAIQQRQREAQNELARELMPIGMGFTKLFTFYLGDIDRLAKFLLVTDLVWCICKLFSREISQIIFERKEDFYPSSSCLTPIMVEERVIRITRIIFDIYFIKSIHQKTLGHTSWWILPKIMESIISVGIFLFVIASGSDCDTAFAPFVLVLFSLFFISDLIFRIVLVVTSLKSHNSHCEKIANSVRKRRNQQQTNAN